MNKLLEEIVIGPLNKFEKVQRNFAVSLLAVNSRNFTGLSFSGNVRESQLDLKDGNVLLQLGDSIPKPAAASISVPRIIFNEFANIKNGSNQQTVIFILYKETKFFRRRLTDNRRTSSRLSSLVIAGSVKGFSVTNLSDPVKIALESTLDGDKNSTLCSFWNFSIGNWSQEGCRFDRVLPDGRLLCNCDHLTNFAMLLVSLVNRILKDMSIKLFSMFNCCCSNH